MGDVRLIHDRAAAIVVAIDPPLEEGLNFGLGPISIELAGYVLVGASHVGPSIVDWLEDGSEPMSVYVTTLVSPVALTSPKIGPVHIGGTDKASAYRTVEQARAYGVLDQLREFEV